MKTINIEELKRNPYYSNNFLRVQRGLRIGTARRVLDQREGRALTLREYKRLTAIHKEVDSIDSIIEGREGADRAVVAFKQSPKTIDITKHDTPKRKRSR